MPILYNISIFHSIQCWWIPHGGQKIPVHSSALIMQWYAHCASFFWAEMRTLSPPNCPGRGCSCRADWCVQSAPRGHCPCPQRLLQQPTAPSWDTTALSSCSLATPWLMVACPPLPHTFSTISKNLLVLCCAIFHKTFAQGKSRGVTCERFPHMLSRREPVGNWGTDTHSRTVGGGAEKLRARHKARWATHHTCGRNLSLYVRRRFRCIYKNEQGGAIHTSTVNLKAKNC